MNRHDKIIVFIILIVLAAVGVIASYRIGFREGQLRAALGVRYWFYDANGYEVHDPQLRLQGRD